MKKFPRLLQLSDFLSILFVLTALCLVIFYTPMELEMGLVQKVFYFHVASTWTGMLGFTLATVAAVSYLKTRNLKWDKVGVAGVEIGMVFVALGIVTGSIWAKPIWNTWWTWDPRLTTTLIMELIYVAYLILRSGVDDHTHRARYSAVYCIIGFASVPLTFLSIRIFRTIHPVIISGSGAFAMSGRMLFTFIFSLIAFSILFISLFWHRFRLEERYEELENLATVTEIED